MQTAILPTTHIAAPRSPLYPASPTFHLHRSPSSSSLRSDVQLHSNPARSHGAMGRVPVIFRRLFKFSQMDWELAAWQLTWLCIAPKRVYRNVYFHKVSPIDGLFPGTQVLTGSYSFSVSIPLHDLKHTEALIEETKNYWARDDPAILIMISVCLLVSAVAWSFVHSYEMPQIIRLAFMMIFRDFLAVGALIATCLWFISNKLLLQPPTAYNVEESTRVEWAYAFDVHTNAFFPLYLSLYLAQLFLAPVITKDNWVCLWVGNSLYLASLAQYTYITYLGFNALPFLVRSELLLFPLLPLFVGYLISLLGFNVSKHVLAAYFS